MGYLERNLLSTQDLSGITSGSLGITSGSRVPTILPTAIPDTTYLGSARSTTLLQPFALTIFGDGPSDAARAAASETSSTGTTFSATRIALGCGPCYLELPSLYSSSCALHCINQCDPLCASLHMRASAPLSHPWCYYQDSLLHLDTFHHYCVRWVPACPHFCQRLS